MRETFKTTREDLDKDLQALIRDTKELLKNTADNVSGDAADLRKRLEERLEGIQKTVRQKARGAVDAAEEGLEGAEEAIREGLKTTDDVIRRHPYPAIGISLGVGILLGVLLRRHR